MQTPGTAAINIPAFTAPAFTPAKISFGAKVTDFSIESTSDVAQVNVPFTFGQPFAQGDLAFTDGLDAVGGSGVLALQVDAKATWPDGSLRHAVISGVLPELASRAVAKFDLKRRTRPALTAGGKLSAFDAKVDIFVGGKTYTASLNDIPPEFNLNGAVMRELIGLIPLRAEDGTVHPDLMVAMQDRGYYGIGNTRWDVAIEHTKVYGGTGDLTYDVAVVANGVRVYEKKGLTQYLNTRWRKTVWLGTAPAIHIRHNVNYLLDSKAVPNYDRTLKIAESLLQSYDGVSFDPMTSGRFTADMGTTGGRPEIALAPESYAVAVISMDRRAKAMMLAEANAGGAFGVHRRDTSGGGGSGRPMSLMYWPYATIVGREGDSNNPDTGKREVIYAPASKSPFRAESAHEPDVAYIPYLLTGDFYYLEEMHFWCGFNLYQSNPGYRGAVRGLINWDQVRGQAWALRNLAECAAVTPDGHQDKAAFVYWLQQNIDNYTAKYVATSLSPLGILLDNAVLYNGNRGVAPWQDDFFTQSLGRAVEMGFESALPLLKWKAAFQLGRMNASGVCWNDAAVYALNVRDSASSPLYTSLAQCYANTMNAKLLALNCNSAERVAFANSIRGSDEQVFVVGEMTGYSHSSIGYPSNYQPALAMCVDLGLDGGAEAWNKFATRTVQPDYSKSPQFAIVPRRIVVDQPLPGNTMTFKIIVAGFDSAVQNLPAGSDAALSSIRIEILSPDGAAVIGKSDTLPYSLGGLQAGVYPIRLSAIDSKGSVMGVPATATADTASAPTLPPALIAVSLPSAISFSVAQEQ